MSSTVTATNVSMTPGTAEPENRKSIESSTEYTFPSNNEDKVLLLLVNYSDILKDDFLQGCAAVRVPLHQCMQVENNQVEFKKGWIGKQIVPRIEIELDRLFKAWDIPMSAKDVVDAAIAPEAREPDTLKKLIAFFPLRDPTTPLTMSTLKLGLRQLYCSETKNSSTLRVSFVGTMAKLVRQSILRSDDLVRFHCRMPTSMNERCIARLPEASVSGLVDDMSAAMEVQKRKAIPSTPKSTVPNRSVPSRQEIMSQLKARGSALVSVLQRSAKPLVTPTSPSSSTVQSPASNRSPPGDFVSPARTSTAAGTNSYFETNLGTYTSAVEDTNTAHLPDIDTGRSHGSHPGTFFDRSHHDGRTHYNGDGTGYDSDDVETVYDDGSPRTVVRDPSTYWMHKWAPSDGSGSIGVEFFNESTAPETVPEPPVERVRFTVPPISSIKNAGDFGSGYIGHGNDSDHGSAGSVFGDGSPYRGDGIGKNDSRSFGTAVPSSRTRESTARYGSGAGGGGGGDPGRGTGGFGGGDPHRGPDGGNYGNVRGGNGGDPPNWDQYQRNGFRMRPGREEIEQARRYLQPVDGYDWRQHYHAPMNTVTTVWQTGLVPPWKAYRPGYGSILAHPVRIDTQYNDFERFMSNFARSRAYTMTDSTKRYTQFMKQFPPYPSGTPYLSYMNRIVIYGSMHGVYIPPVSTLREDAIMGIWCLHLPTWMRVECESTVAPILAACLQNKATNLVTNADLEVLIRDQNDGYLIFYELASRANHPALNEHAVLPTPPRQKTDESLSVHLNNWLGYAGEMILNGLYLSDRYYVKQAIVTAHPSVRDPLEPRIDALMDHQGINEALHPSFAPSRLASKIAGIASQLRKSTLVTKSPRELSTRSSSGTIQALTVAAVNQGTKVCFLCQGDHYCNEKDCPALVKIKSNQFAARQMVKLLGGSRPRGSRDGPRRPKESGALVNQVDTDGTDDGSTVASAPPDADDDGEDAIASGDPTESVSDMMEAILANADSDLPDFR